MTCEGSVFVNEENVENLRPNESEILFLTHAYNRFYDIFEEVRDDSFWEKDDWYRFCKIRDAFSIYSECLNYEPIRRILDVIKEKRPPMEAEIGKELFKFIRNVIIHFPFHEKWDDVWVSKKLVNWYREGQTIDRFLNQYVGHEVVKYRFWEADKKKMTYLSINFPKSYTDDEKIYLKDIVTEKEGGLFCIIFMNQILTTQVEEIDGKKI